MDGIPSCLYSKTVHYCFCLFVPYLLQAEMVNFEQFLWRQPVSCVNFAAVVSMKNNYKLPNLKNLNVCSFSFFLDTKNMYTYALGHFAKTYYDMASALMVYVHEISLLNIIFLPLFRIGCKFYSSTFILQQTIAVHDALSW